MSQHDLNREISRATGESINTIAGMGFVELRRIPFERERRTKGLEEHDPEHNVAVIQRHHRRDRAV